MLKLEEQLRRYGEAIGESLDSGGGPDGTDGDEFHRLRSTTRWSPRRVLLIVASLVVAGTVTAARANRRAIRPPRRS